MNISKNVLFYTFGEGAQKSLISRMDSKRIADKSKAVIFVDRFFGKSSFVKTLDNSENFIYEVNSGDEPSTDSVDLALEKSRSWLNGEEPCCVVGLGGGSTLDTAKAVSNLFTNPGKAEDYQGWDLVKNPGVYKIGVPTISGTGAEASRTCVMMNVKKNLKLGMNSEYTIFDELVLDPTLSSTVPRDQYFYTGMDTYIHCIESLAGHFRHFIGDSFGEQALAECRKVFNSEDYQGWDLVKNPGVYKIGVPTISGTGAEASRTCVMMNVKKNLKLGMNSEYTIFDELVLDPTLSSTVPRDQYFYTGMDTYIHCIESLAGHFRHFIGDSFGEQALAECRKVFNSEEDMMSDVNRSRLMVASYLGGAAIANSYVGLIHPFSAGLSVVLGIHHCLANCIAFNQLAEFYPQEHEEFQKFLEKNEVNLPVNVCNGLSSEDLNRLYDSTIIHEKPLANALGNEFNKTLTKDKVIEIFSRM
jgi:3-deoxy-alpha-D-manno-octulosonate 8-oxidase